LRRTSISGSSYYKKGFGLEDMLTTGIRAAQVAAAIAVSRRNRSNAASSPLGDVGAIMYAQVRPHRAGTAKSGG